MFVRVMTTSNLVVFIGRYHLFVVLCVSVVKLIRNVKYSWYNIASTFIEKSNFENEDYIENITNMP